MIIKKFIIFILIYYYFILLFGCGEDIYWKASSISSGYSHSCALINEKEIKCWGFNMWTGSLGDGTWDNHNIPVNVVGINDNITQISAGNDHTCAVTLKGNVKCWGDNRYYSQLGNGNYISSNMPVDVLDISNIVYVSAGDGYTCALSNDGGVKCWGAIPGLKYDSTELYQPKLPTDIDKLSSGIKRISAGKSHVCVLTIEGGVKCWGYNYFGQLGDNTIDDKISPIDVFNLSKDIIEISSGSYHTCALNINGEVFCWGEYLDSGNYFWKSLIPEKIVDLNQKVIAISAGDNYTCLITSEMGVKCRGINNVGQLGNGTRENSTILKDVIGLNSNAVDISAGSDHTCAIIYDGSVLCWGSNQWGQLGNGSYFNSSDIPVKVKGSGNK